MVGPVGLLLDLMHDFEGEIEMGKQRHHKELVFDEVDRHRETNILQLSLACEQRCMKLGHFVEKTGRLDKELRRDWTVFVHIIFANRPWLQYVR